MKLAPVRVFSCKHPLRKQQMTPARARTQTFRFGVQRTGHQATAPTTQVYYTIVFYFSQGYKN